MASPITTPANEGDFSEVLALNQACVPHVSELTLDDLREIAAEASYFKVIRVGSKLAGFLIALEPGRKYPSLNYRWFEANCDSFIYVDRVAFADEFRGAGLGRTLYADLEREFTGGAARITCEVNLRPPNPQSLAFHHRLGFVEVGQQDTEGGKKRVSLLAKPLG